MATQEFLIGNVRGNTGSTGATGNTGAVSLEILDYDPGPSFVGIPSTLYLVVQNDT